MLSATAYVAKSAQNYPKLPKTAQICQNLPKSAQRQNFEISPKIEILVFFKTKNFYM
jgi:hypothetical protein